jgi:hypothetical protein
MHPNADPMMKAVFGTAVATLKRDKREKSRRTPCVRRAFIQRLQCKTRIFELRGGKSEKRAPSCVSHLSDALLVPAVPNRAEAAALTS